MNYLSQIINKQLIGDIRFWLVVFFIVRLFHITNPPLEISHNWRQTTVTMVARNFYEVNPNILYPRLDFAGDKTGVTGMEFPILNYLIYLMSLVFGYEHWYGRLINLIVSTIGVYFFFKLIKRYFNQDLAFTSAIILLFSIWFPFSRKIMPDTFSFSFVLMSLYYGAKYFETKRFVDLLMYSALCLIGIASKLPSGYILIVFSLFIFNTKYSLNSKILFCFSTLVIVLPVLVWYFYWIPHLNKVFDFSHFFMGGPVSDSIQQIFSHLYETAFNFFDSALKYIGFLFFLIGLFFVFKNKEKAVCYIFLLSFIVFIVVVLKSGFVFYLHNYYIIPFVPVMALVCGCGLMQFKNIKWRYIFLVLIATEGILNYQHDFFINPNQQAICNLQQDFDRISGKKDLILINSGDVPTPIYFAHRKGWIAHNDSVLNENYVINLQKKGLKFIVILKKAFGKEITLELPIAISNSNYDIYKIQ